MNKFFYFLLIISLLSCNQNKSNLISAYDFDEMIKLDKKRKIKSAIDQGKAIPTELRNDARELKHEMENDIETLEERYFLRFYVSILSLPFTLLYSA